MGAITGIGAADYEQMRRMAIEAFTERFGRNPTSVRFTNKCLGELTMTGANLHFGIWHLQNLDELGLAGGTGRITIAGDWWHFGGATSCTNGSGNGNFLGFVIH